MCVGKSGYSDFLIAQIEFQQYSSTQLQSVLNLFGGLCIGSVHQRTSVVFPLIRQTKPKSYNPKYKYKINNWKNKNRLSPSRQELSWLEHAV